MTTRFSPFHEFISLILDLCAFLCHLNVQCQLAPWEDPASLPANARSSATAKANSSREKEPQQLSTKLHHYNLCVCVCMCGGKKVFR